MRYGFQCFISDYTYRVGQYCEGNDIGSYTMHTAAEAACSNNVECGCIHDEACDGDRWSISKGYKVRASSTGSCAWTSSKLKQPSHTRRLMYFTYSESTFKKMQFQSTCSIADEYTHFEYKHCKGAIIQQYTTLQAAKAACLNNTECGCMYDPKCDGGSWNACKGSAIWSHSSDSCAWIRGNC